MALDIFKKNEAQVSVLTFTFLPPCHTFLPPCHTLVSFFLNQACCRKLFYLIEAKGMVVGLDLRGPLGVRNGQYGHFRFFAENPSLVSLLYGESIFMPLTYP